MSLAMEPLSLALGNIELVQQLSGSNESSNGTTKFGNETTGSSNGNTELV